MKTKVFKYSASVLNKVVCATLDLERVNDHVWLSLAEKDRYDESYDLYMLVIKIGEVYFVEGTYRRYMIEREDFVQRATACAENYDEGVQQIINQGGFIALLQVKVFEALGWDTAPLLEHRAKREEACRLKCEEEARQQEQERIEDEQREEQRLDAAKTDFLAGKFISREDFLTLAKRDGIVIPIQTTGTFRRTVDEVCPTAMKITRTAGKRKPDYTGCHRVLKEYLGKNEQQPPRQ